MLRSLTLLGLTLAIPAQADAPKVVTDIAPVHSLTSMVMEGVGTPDLILKPGISPHSYAMRPSEAAALEQAELVIWIGAELTPWLEDPLTTIGANAASLALFDHAPMRIVLDEEEHGEHGDDEDHDDHDHAEHDDHDHGEHDDHAEHDDHGHDDHAEAGHDDHDHGGVDPHAWLDPLNAAHWVGEIAEHLAEIDPENAAIYEANAVKAEAELLALHSQIRAALTPIKTKSYAVHHEAYAYFEARYGLTHSFAITDSHAQKPGPARIAELQAKVRKEGISCILTNRAAPPDLLTTVLEGQQAEVILADPLGVEIPLGPLLYKGVISGISLALVNC